jgi:NADH-quinone oxidoreductase subunit J
MNPDFLITSAVAVVSTAMVITRLHLVHALLYLVVSFLSVAAIFLLLGAPFAAALEVIIYAGAIMVLFVFAIMMLGFGPHAGKSQDHWLSPEVWVGPALLSLVLLIELILLAARSGAKMAGTVMVGPKEVGLSLFSVYALGVELASVLLMAGIVGAFHLGRHDRREGEGK